MKKTLFHYSGEVDLCPYPGSQDRSIGFKPDGLWLGDEEHGEKWPEILKCRTGLRADCSYRFAVDVDLNRLIILSNAREIEKFHERYRHEPPGAEGFLLSGLDLRVPEWERVALDYAGILISPYFRTEVSWLNYWDLSSACIWNPEAITRVERDDSWTAGGITVTNVVHS